MTNQSKNSGCGSGCGCLSILFLIALPFYNAFGTLATIITGSVIILLIILVTTVNEKYENKNATENDILWEELVEPSIIHFSNNSVEEVVKNLIGQKDIVSSEVFQAGEKVYVCVSCQLGYHEDSWQFLNQACEQCKSSNVKRCTLPFR